MDPSPTAIVPALIAREPEDSKAFVAALTELLSCGIPLIAVVWDSGGSLPDLNVVAAQPDLALTAGLVLAGQMGFTHAVALSASGVFHPDDMSLLLKAAADNPCALILGIRPAAELPGLGTRLSDLLLRLETGLRPGDTRGPRVYPLRLIDVIDPRRQRNLNDIEIFARAVWAGCPVVPVQLPALPLAPRAVRSRWQAVRNMSKEFATHARLLARALSGWPHPKYDAGASHKAHSSFWRSMGQWFNPLRAWRDLRQGGLSRNEMAAGIAVGVFIANTPAWGLHTVLSVYAARRLHLHPLAVVTGSHISAPPMGAILVAGAMILGHVLLHGSRPKWENVTPFNGHPFSNGIPLLIDWLLGAVLIGTGLSIITFIICNFLFRIFEKRNPSTPVA